MSSEKNRYAVKWCNRKTGWSWLTLSDLAKYTMTWSIARSLCDSWASCHCLASALARGISCDLPYKIWSRKSPWVSVTRWWKSRDVRPFSLHSELADGQTDRASKQASLFAQLINNDIISMNNVQGQAARKSDKAQHCWPPCKDTTFVAIIAIIIT